MISVPVGVVLQILNVSNIIQFEYILESSVVCFCLSTLFFINRDPKYTFYRGGMWVITMLGIVNTLPFLESQFKLVHTYQNGNLDFIFKLGIQDNWVISVGLLVVALYLFFKQPEV